MIEIDAMDMEDTMFLNELENFLMPDRAVPTYSSMEREIILNHIDTYFGESSFTIADDEAHLMKVDMQVTRPTAERPFYTIVTVGMGAMLMNVPRSIANGSFSRAELMITLPVDWKLDSNARRWRWPIAFMENISRIPLIENSWFSAGHIIPIRRSISDNTKLSGFILLEPQDSSIQSYKCMMPDGSDVNFYQLIPLYNEEIEFEKRYGFEALLDRMADISHIVDVNRLNSCGEPSSLMQ